MDPGIAYSVLAVLVRSVYIFALKRYFPGYSGAVLTVVVNIFTVLLYFPVMAVTYDPAAVPSLTELGVTGAGIVTGTAALVGVAPILFVDALEAGDVSHVVLVSKFVPVFVLPIEILFLNQFLAGVQILGVAVATVAVCVANYEGGAFLDPLRHAVRSRPAQLALANATCYAVSDVGKRVTLQELGILMSAFVPVLFVGSALAVLPVAVQEWPDTRGDLPKFAAAGALVAVGEHVTSTAFGLVSASVASPIVSMQAIVAVVLGEVVLREARFGTRLVAAVLAVAGVSLIALGDAAALHILVGQSPSPRATGFKRDLRQPTFMYDRFRGFRDFYPGKMSARREVVDTVETAAARYGFREIGTPHLERTQMYVDKSGEETVEELYVFEDKGGREVAFAPELTPTVARMVIAKQQVLSEPIKRVSTRPFWRYEQVQQGRFREFYQTNADIFGSSEPEIDAEILAFCANALTDLGLTTDDFKFRVSHRDILGGLLQSFDVDVDVADAVHAVDKSERAERTEYLGLLSDAGLPYDQADEFADLIEHSDLDEIAALGGDDVEAAVKNLRDVLATADDFGTDEFREVSPSTTRGLDYYTGVVPECFNSTGDVSRAAFGGSRYDDLIESFGGQSTPAIGVGIGGTTLRLPYQRAGVWPDEELATNYYLLTAGDTRGVASDIARDLRAAGSVIEVDVSDRSFGAQMSYAGPVNVDTVVIIGKRDLENGEVTAKDTASGDQTTAPVDDSPGDRDASTYKDHEWAASWVAPVTPTAPPPPIAAAIPAP